jgi:hypothetical protein
MNETSGGTGGGQLDVDARIQARLDEITSPDYVDPARRDLTGLDWLVFLGFLIGCSVVFGIWAASAGVY